MNKILRYLLLSLLTIVATGTYAKRTVTIDFDNDYQKIFPTLTGVSSSDSNAGDFTEATYSDNIDGIMLGISPAEEGTPSRIWSTSPRLRLYSGGLAVAAINGEYIEKIEFNAHDKNFNIASADPGVLTDRVWTDDGKNVPAVVFVIAKNTQIRSITVTLRGINETPGEDNPDTPSDPDDPFSKFDITSGSITDNGNQLLVEFAGKLTEMDVRGKFTFDFENDLCTGCTASVTFPSAELAQAAYQDAVSQGEAATIDGNTVSTNASEGIVGLSKIAIKSMMKVLIDKEAGGVGTMESPLTPNYANIYAGSLGKDATTEEDVYVKGKIASIKYEFSAQYGTATFFISADGQNDYTFQCYSVNYLENKPWVEGNAQIKVGDEVVICGKLVNFKGTTPETASKKAYVYSLNGKTKEEGSAPEPEIQEITVAKALELINALEDGKTTADTYKVKGFIVGAPDFQRKAADNTLYGNVNFTIADEKGGTTTLTVFRAKDLENVNFTEETINRIKEGDEVVVQGKLQKYVKNEVVTPELTNGYLISVTAGEDPNPGIDPNATIIEVPVSKFAPWDNCTIEGNVITMGEGWKGGAIYIGADMTQFDYVWIKFKNAKGTPNFGITYDEWLKNESWGPSFAATTTAMDGTGMVGIKLDKKTVMVHGNAETDGVGIGDVYAQHVQQVTIQGGSSAASVEVEGIWFGTAEEFVKAGGDVPVRPEAGSSLTMWEGELVYNGWGVSSTVDAKYFEVAEVGDIIYCSVKDVTADYNPLFKNVSDWSDFTDIQATLAKDETHFEGKIATAEALGNLQKNGLRFQGVGFTLTKVELKVSDPSGVNTINAAKIENGAIYNVAGQKVNAGYKGLVIKNGKKFIQK